MAIELISRPPFFRFMPSKSFALNDRLMAAVYFGQSGTPKRFRISKATRFTSWLVHSDTHSSIDFPAPSASFRRILTQQPYTEQENLGRYRWNWTKDGTLFSAWDDMEFYFSRDETKLLDDLLFGERGEADDLKIGL